MGLYSVAALSRTIAGMPKPCTIYPITFTDFCGMLLDLSWSLFWELYFPHQFSQTWLDKGISLAVFMLCFLFWI